VALVGTMTIWSLFSAFLLFPRFGLPRFLQHGAAALLALEIIAILAYSYAADGCAQAPCSVTAEAWRVLASQDLPALAVLLIVLALGTGVRRAALTTRSR
jgi:hypothetical protein